MTFGPHLLAERLAGFLAQSVYCPVRRHVIRKSKLENLAMIGKFDGKIGSGRPRTSYLTSVKKWLDPTAKENTIIQASATRQR